MIQHLSIEPIGPSFALPFEFRVVGTGFGDRPSAIRKHCEKGCEVELRREPGNSHDRNAWAVILKWKGIKRMMEDQIGYVPADLAAELTDLTFNGVLRIDKTAVVRVMASPDDDVPRVTVRIEGQFLQGATQLELP